LIAFEADKFSRRVAHVHLRKVRVQTARVGEVFLAYFANKLLVAASLQFFVKDVTEKLDSGIESR
jgi:hypothetical protein